MSRRLALSTLIVVGLLACEDDRLSFNHPPHQAERDPAHPIRKRDVLVEQPHTEAGSDSAGPRSEAGSGSAGGSAPAGGSPMTGTKKPTRCAVVGDYGWAGVAEQRVAELVAALHPDCVLTTGDNNYPDGAAATIDANIGQFFSDFIFPYRGAYGAGAAVNRFFPVLGNHDWDTDAAGPYLDYFALPGNERYYDVVIGDIHFFALDSDAREPDGVDAASSQAKWLQAGLQQSRSAFQVVAMHHPPFSSGPHGSSPTMQWPYREWGADLVVAGHDHGYERLERDGLTYVVSGLGGASIYSFDLPLEGSVVRYSKAFGTALIDVDDSALRLSFVDVDGQVVDSATILAKR